MYFEFPTNFKGTASNTTIETEVDRNCPSAINS
jgi:hypothetical protein